MIPTHQDPPRIQTVHSGPANNRHCSGCGVGSWVEIGVVLFDAGPIKNLDPGEIIPFAGKVNYYVAPPPSIWLIIRRSAAIARHKGLRAAYDHFLSELQGRRIRITRTPPPTKSPFRP